MDATATPRPMTVAIIISPIEGGRDVAQVNRQFSDRDTT